MKIHAGRSAPDTEHRGAGHPGDQPTFAGGSGYAAILRPVMPELDVVRGLAVLLVVFYHGFFWSNSSLAGQSFPVRAILHGTRAGWLGVELFFVLSGFLISNILLGGRARPDYYRRFYTRRALRILPAYAVLIVVLLVFGFVGWKFAVVSSLFLANVSTYLGVPMEYGPLWSLAVEEHFYLVWPTAVRHLSERVLMIVVGTIIVIEPIVRLIAFHYGFEVYGPTWFMLDGLAFGAFLALAVRRTGQDRRMLLKLVIGCAAASAALVVVGLPYGIGTRNRALGAALQVTPWYLLFTAFIGGMLLIGSSPGRRFVNIRFFVFFGQISYGLYLVHLLGFSMFDKVAEHFWPAFSAPVRDDRAVLLRFVGGAAISIVLAYISRWTLEEFFLRIKDRGGKQRWGERAAIATDLQTPERASDSG